MVQFTFLLKNYRKGESTLPNILTFHITINMWKIKIFFTVYIAKHKASKDCKR